LAAEMIGNLQNWHTALQELQQKLPNLDILLNKDEVLPYASDMTEDFVFPPIAVARPAHVEEVQAICSICNVYKLPIHPRGAGTSLSGGSLPTAGGISVSLEKMNRILDIDEENFQAVVEPGVINEDLRSAVAEKGLFYGVDPASKGSCFLGGNVAHNSGGPRALKYGVTAQNVLNLQVVLPNGSTFWTGSDTLKNSTGYNLTQLFTGSEGSLGIITKIVVKLHALPKQDRLLLAGFPDARKACDAVTNLMKTSYIPSAIEIMEHAGVQASLDYTGLVNPLAKDHPFYLLVETNGNSGEELMNHCIEMTEALEKSGVEDVLFADDAETKEKWWKIRRIIGEAVKTKSIYKEEDVVVKRSSMGKVFEYLNQLKEEYGFDSISYGHAGDGNVHINILKGGMTDEAWNGVELETAIRLLFRKAKELGGTISGEHGIGYVQKKYMNEVMPEEQIELMRGIKRVFDPNGIMNPGKIFD
jgi:glycolate oxidase